MNEQTSQPGRGLTPQYQDYHRQKCFIAFTQQSPWSTDLLTACEVVLAQPEFYLELDYYSKNFDPNITLRQKAVELISNARYGIYDLSSWQDKKGNWNFPRNVFIELGIAIALNRPTLLLRHESNRNVELPECLQSVSQHILPFSGEVTLKEALARRLPQWLEAKPEQDWWNRHCIFGRRICDYREAHPGAKGWGSATIRCHIGDGPDIDRRDYRGVVEEVLDQYSDVAFDYMDGLPLTEGYNFLLCTHCQTVRQSPVAIYRITEQTPAETYIAIGMSVALETQYEYKIPKMLMTKSAADVPSLLAGYEVVEAQNDTERKDLLRKFVPTVIHQVQTTTWKPLPLPFVEIERPVEDALADEDATAEQREPAAIGGEYVWIPDGEFLMGSERYESERPVHQVRISLGFELGKYQVTQDQWEAVMGENPSRFHGFNRPVENVSWDDAREFIKRLNGRDRTYGYRLPTEAEWEYACRAGSETEYSFGDDGEQLGEYAWYWDNAGRETYPVGQKRPNALGLYDMHGNVWEWCQDEWHGSYDGAPTDGSAWMDGSGSYRVVRGGSWSSFAGYCRSAFRSYYSRDDRLADVGFRLVTTAR